MALRLASTIVIVIVTIVWLRQHVYTLTNYFQLFSEIPVDPKKASLVYLRIGLTLLSVLIMNTGCYQGDNQWEKNDIFKIQRSERLLLFSFFPRPNVCLHNSDTNGVAHGHGEKTSFNKRIEKHVIDVLYL
jgi:hypothetical protein